MEGSSEFQYRVSGSENGRNVPASSAGGTVSLGNVAYQVVSAPTTTASTLSASATSKPMQATAILASSLNGQFYVIGSPGDVLGSPRNISPKLSLASPPQTTTTTTSTARHDRRRATHNEVERRRRDNINAWIMKLGRLIPPDHESGPPKSQVLSKGGILARACEYIQELRDSSKDSPSKFGGGSDDCLRLQCQVEELKQENEILRQQIEALSKQLEAKSVESILS